MTDQSQAVAIRPAVTAGGAVGALVPQTIDEAWRLSEAFSKAAILPRGITTPAQVMLVICGGAEVGFGPFQSLQSFYLVNNRLSIWGDAIPALLWTHGFKIKEWFENVDPAYPDNMTARCIVTRPDGQEIEGEFSVADAKEAKLWTKDGPWQTARKRMLKMRARAFAARDGAPDVLRGVAIREEVEDYEVTPTPGRRAKADLKSKLAGPAEGQEGFNAERVAAETSGGAAAADDTIIDVQIDDQQDADQADATGEETDGEADTENVFAGPAPQGTRYLLSSDEPDENDSVPVYLDGAALGLISVEQAIEQDLPTYDEHAQPPTGQQAEAEQPAAGQQPQEEDSVLAQMAKMESWLQIRPALIKVYDTAEFKALPFADQIEFRRAVAGLVQKIGDPVKPTDDAAFFRVWMDTQEGVEGADAIEAMYRDLKRAPAYAKVSAAGQETLKKLVEVQTAYLRKG